MTEFWRMHWVEAGSEGRSASWAEDTACTTARTHDGRKEGWGAVVETSAVTACWCVFNRFHTHFHSSRCMLHMKTHGYTDLQSIRLYHALLYYASHVHTDMHTWPHTHVLIADTFVGAHSWRFLCLGSFLGLGQQLPLGQIQLVCINKVLPEHSHPGH